MRAILQVLAVALVFSVLSLPAGATGVHSEDCFFQLNPEALQPTAASLTTQDIKQMTMGQAAAILGGAIVGGSIIDRVLDGTVFTLMGVVAGAVLGNEWYERGMWPF